MPVKANWYLDALDLPVTPEVAAAEIGRLQSAPVVDLRRSDQIAADFAASVEREATLAYSLYQECDLKWSVATDDGTMRNPCRTCPLFCHDESHPDSMLCKLGLQQEDLLDAFALAQMSEGMDGDIIAAVERELDGAHELAEAVLA